MTRPARLLPRIPYALCSPAALLFALFLLAPALLTLALSLRAFDDTRGIGGFAGLANYLAVLTDPYFLWIFGRTFAIAALTTLFCILLGVPEAWILYRTRSRLKPVYLVIVLGPLLVSVVVRTLGWAILLGPNGIVGRMLGVFRGGQPVQLMFTDTAIVIALVHVLVPFLILTVWSALQRLDPNTLRAARSLGASELAAVLRIAVPQAAPGIFSGAVIVFSLAASAFATPEIVGGRRLKVAATLVYDQFTGTLDWPLGATLAAYLLLVTLAILVLSNRLFHTDAAEVRE